MIKYQKKPILVLAAEPTYIRHEARGKHNEVTVVVAHYAIPLNNVLYQGKNALNNNIMRAAFSVSKGLQGIDFTFNGNINSPAFTFVVKAKTERRGEDSFDQKLADRIVIAKANSKACIIAKRVLSTIIQYYEKEVASLNNICEVLSSTSARELSYIQKV